MFQSTHPRGVRHVADKCQTYQQCVSIHAPARGATQLRTNPVELVAVSIHAPARGATAASCDLGVVSHVSIHAPARGATNRYFPILKRRNCFNPRTREGCDGGIPGNLVAPFRVSIHAPARGATPQPDSWRHPGAGFQSTHPRGVRRRHIVRVICVRLFQSTHPRGVRRLPR